MLRYFDVFSEVVLIKVGNYVKKVTVLVPVERPHRYFILDSQKGNAFKMERNHEILSLLAF